MKRVFVVVLAIAAVSPPARASTPAAHLSFASVARGVLPQTAHVRSALLEPDAAPVVLPAGDLDGDGDQDAVLAAVSPTTAEATVRALSGATGTILWELPPVALRGATDGTMWIGPQLRFDGDEAPDVLVVLTTSLSTAAVAISGSTGEELWRDEAAGIAGSISAGPDVGGAIPLALPGDLDRDSLDEVLLGRYTGVRTDPSTVAWTLRATLLSGGGTAIAEWAAAGGGIAPTAAIVDLDGHGIQNQHHVLIADGMRSPTLTHVSVRDYWSFAVEPYRYVAPSSFLTAAPSTVRDVGLTLTGLAGEGFPTGGFEVGFVAAGPFGGELRGAITGPTSLVGLGRGGLERYRVTLPSSAVVQRPGDVDGDGIQDLRTTRVDGDALIVETWSGHGSSMALLPPHQMTYLEADDYPKAVDVRPEMGDSDGDGIRELLAGGGFPCGPRYEVIRGDTGEPAWGRPELRSLLCFGRLIPAGVSLGGAQEDVVDWTTNWSCCLFGPMPAGVDVRARDGVTGAQLWASEIADVNHAVSMSIAPLGDEVLLVAFEQRFGTPRGTFAVALDAPTGLELWRVAPEG